MTYSPEQLTVNRGYGQNQYYEELIAVGCRPVEMMRISSGNFLMGSSADELDRYDEEGPQREVAVAQYFLAKYPVTQAQWRDVASMSQVNRELKLHPSSFEGYDRPVEQVSWYEAVEFCDRLTQHTDRQYRLPTEAEWEYACRAGTTTPFHFGKTITTNLANYCGQDRTIREIDYSGSYGPGPKGQYREKTTPVDTFDTANDFGLCDMHGNVWEWCEDHWHNNYIDRPVDSSAWLTDDETARRIVRGGSWFYYPRNCRSAQRFSFVPVNAGASVGFRVCCSAPKSTFLV